MLRKWRGCRHVEAEGNINRRGDMFIHFRRGYKKIGCGCKSQARRVNRKATAIVCERRVLRGKDLL
jgi:hypothetical protein